MSKSKRVLSTDEKRLWREVAKTVKTRKALLHVEEATPAASVKPPSRTARTSTPAVKPAPLPRLPFPLANRGAERKVRRGNLEIDAKLDLHGHTQDQAQAALARFLRASKARGDRTVIVITGVGRGGEGIIKRRFTDWIADRDLRTIISGYAPAHRTHGGAGAFYVFLKRTT